MLQPQPSLARFGSGQAETIHNPVSSIQNTPYTNQRPQQLTPCMHVSVCATLIFENPSAVCGIMRKFI